jgi:hypothetical protein
VSKFRVVLRDEEAEAQAIQAGVIKPISFFSPTKAQAMRDARKNIEGKPGVYAEIYESVETLVDRVMQ